VVRKHRQFVAIAIQGVVKFCGKEPYLQFVAVEILWFTNFGVEDLSSKNQPVTCEFQGFIDFVVEIYKLRIYKLDCGFITFSYKNM
jgi:hypothetical protein